MAYALRSEKMEIPQVSQADIDDFHTSHFSTTAVNTFVLEFLSPHDANSPYEQHAYEEQYYDEEEEDDGLGYYPDGVKRTLTDEQIAIFRHSELEALKRDEAKTRTSNLSAISEAHESAERSGRNSASEMREAEDGEASEDGELEGDAPRLTKQAATRLKRQRARARKSQKRKFQPEPKPDLRKRTWDVVEAGMDTLDYDDLEDAQGSGSNQAAQRRKISYDD